MYSDGNIFSIWRQSISTFIEQIASWKDNISTNRFDFHLPQMVISHWDCKKKRKENPKQDKWENLFFFNPANRHSLALRTTKTMREIRNDFHLYSKDRISFFRHILIPIGIIYAKPFIFLTFASWMIQRIVEHYFIIHGFKMLN